MSGFLSAKFGLTAKSQPDINDDKCFFCPLSAASEKQEELHYVGVNNNISQEERHSTEPKQFGSYFKRSDTI
jgi:hypothetical protein